MYKNLIFVVIYNKSACVGCNTGSIKTEIYMFEFRIFLNPDAIQKAKTPSLSSYGLIGQRTIVFIIFEKLLGPCEMQNASSKNLN